MRKLFFLILTLSVVTIAIHPESDNNQAANAPIDVAEVEAVQMDMKTAIESIKESAGELSHASKKMLNAVKVVTSKCIQHASATMEPTKEFLHKNAWLKNPDLVVKYMLVWLGEKYKRGIARAHAFHALTFDKDGNPIEHSA